LIGAGIALLVALALAIQPSRKAVTNRFLAAALACLGLDLLNHLVQVRLANPSFIFLAQIGYLVGFLYGPFFYFYTKGLTEPDFRPTSRLVWHLIPFLCAAAVVADLRTVETIRAVFGSRTDQVFQSAQQLQQWIYGLLIYRVYRKHRKRIANHFSDTNHIDLKWARNLSLAIVILGSLAFLNSASNRTLLPNLYFGASLLTLYIAYFGFTQPKIYAFEEEATALPKKEHGSLAKSSLPQIKLESKAAEIRKLMQTQKPYLEGNLTLAKLARLARIPAHDLSLVINREIGKNFFDFVNEYRVRDAKKRLREKEVNILEVAFDVGFNSKSTFYSAFKRFENCTPLQFRERSLGATGQLEPSPT